MTVVTLYSILWLEKNQDAVQYNCSSFASCTFRVPIVWHLVWLEGSERGLRTLNPYMCYSGIATNVDDDEKYAK